MYFKDVTFLTVKKRTFKQIIKFLPHWTSSRGAMSQKVHKKTTEKFTTENFIYVFMLMSFWLFGGKKSKRHQHENKGNFQWWIFPLFFLFTFWLIKVDFFAGLRVLRETALRRFWTALKKIAAAKLLLDGTERADWTALILGVCREGFWTALKN